jgi:hypothetical protein
LPVWPEEIASAIFWAPSRRLTVALTFGNTLENAAPAFSARGATTISPGSRSMFRRTAAATSSGELVPTPGGSLAPDPARAQVLAQALGEAAQAELRRAVERGARRAALARQRRDEHEMARATRRHALAQGPGQHDRRAQIDVEGAVDLVDVEAQQVAGGGQRRVGDEHIDVGVVGG